MSRKRKPTSLFARRDATKFLQVFANEKCVKPVPAHTVDALGEL